MTTTIADPTLSTNVEFILSHLDDLWPKQIAVDDRFNIRANGFNDIIRQFNNCNLINCRINIYPDYQDRSGKEPKDNRFFKRRLHAQDSLVPGGNGIFPSCILIDIDKGSFYNNLGISVISLLNKALLKTLVNIDRLFHGIFKPSILWSGNGYHIIQPIQLSNANNKWVWCLGCFGELTKLTKDPDLEFIRWIGPYLSNNKSDPANSKTVSFKNNYLRVPGTINLKEGKKSEVKIIQSWDGQRPSINWILRDFRRYLIEQKTNKKKRKPKTTTAVFSTDWSNRR